MSTAPAQRAAADPPAPEPLAPPPVNPLQLGQWVCEAQDAAILTTDLDGTSRFRRVTFSPSSNSSEEGDPSGVAIAPVDPLETKPLSGVIDSATIENPSTQRQEIFVLRQGPALDRFAWSDATGAVQQTTSEPAIAGAQRILGALPEKLASQATNTPPLLLGGTDTSGLALWAVAADQSTRTWSLAKTAGASFCAGALVRTILDARLVVLGLLSGQLVAYALEIDSLAKPGPLSAAKLVLGAAGAGAVSVAVAQARPGTSDQQLAVLYTSASGAPQLAILSLDDEGNPVLEKLAPLTLSFATPEATPYYCIAAGDLDVDGRDEIIIGFVARFGDVSGCVALALVAWDTGSTSFAQRSFTVIGCEPTPSKPMQPLASHGLRIAAGMFGDAVTSAVLVMGAASSLAELSSGLLLRAGVVTTGALGTFSAPTEGPLPLMAQQTIAHMSLTGPTFRGLAADLQGISVVLGPPTFKAVQARTQILAILCAPPYEYGLPMPAQQMLQFLGSDSVAQGSDVSSSRTWTTSHDAGLSFGTLGSQLSESMSSSYGSSFQDTQGSTVTTSAHLGQAVTTDDMMIIYSMTYWVWEYPVMRGKAGKQDGTMLVVFPASQVISQTPVLATSREFGYRQPWEPGCLLSYVGARLDGSGLDGQLDDSLLVFKEHPGVAVNANSGGYVTLDYNKTDHEMVMASWDIHNSAHDNEHFALNQDLFGYFSVTCGLSLNNASSYSDTEIQTTTATQTSTLSLSVHGGAVMSNDWSYGFTPIVYQHATLGCMVVAYQVGPPDGSNWDAQDSDYRRACPMLVVPQRRSSNVYLATYSRSIRFGPNDDGEPGPNKDGSVNVRVEIFNRGYTTATSVECRFYSGLYSSASLPNLPPSELYLGSATIDTIAPLGRATVTYRWKTPKDGRCITVAVPGFAFPELGIGWNVYPESEFATLTL